jgi:hypothetical protein
MERKGAAYRITASRPGGRASGRSIYIANSSTRWRYSGAPGQVLTEEQEDEANEAYVRSHGGTGTRQKDDEY